ncbi:MAG: hypothetical protein M3680_35115 [Myxococcota bacterium]|nr:hypothetical protein [Myxococcota bacterium]
MSRVLLSLVVALAACGTSHSSTSADPATSASAARARDAAAGHTLLDDHLRVLQQMGLGATAELMPELDRQAALAKSLETAGRIGPAFARRFDALSDATRALITPAPDAAAREALAQRLQTWVSGVEGGAGLSPENLTMATIAPLMVEELVDLHMLLDGSTDREATRQRYVTPLMDAR